MCELLGVSCYPTTEISFSFSIFRKHSRSNPHGWGYAWLNPQDREWNIVKEPIKAESSIIAEQLIEKKDVFRGTMFLSHIRFATHGRSKVENTHPFQKQLFDKNWVFAHNGALNYMMLKRNFELTKYYPDGQTDSELAFCIILEELKKIGRNATNNKKISTIEDIANKLSEYGGLNFLLSDGDSLFAYHSGYNSLYYVERKPPHQSMIVAKDRDLRISILDKPENERAVIIATVPLTKEKWTHFKPRKLYFFEKGKKDL
ncbi:MAG: class II glutamine amidotransferase [Candidatus Heimdallarchaeaceae archaeon]